MNQDQIDSIVRSGLKMVGGVLLTHGYMNAAAEKVFTSNSTVEAVAGLILAGLGIYASHKSNASTTPAWPPAPPATGAVTAAKPPGQ